jgi:hypothetical protein
VRELNTTLSSLGFNLVQMLFSPSRQQLFATLFIFKALQADNDVFLFYFSGMDSYIQLILLYLLLLFAGHSTFSAAGDLIVSTHETVLSGSNGASASYFPHRSYTRQFHTNQQGMQRDGGVLLVEVVRLLTDVERINATLFAIADSCRTSDGLFVSLLPQLSLSVLHQWWSGHGLSPHETSSIAALGLFSSSCFVFSSSCSLTSSLSRGAVR